MVSEWELIIADKLHVFYTEVQKNIGAVKKRWLRTRSPPQQTNTSANELRIGHKLTVGLLVLWRQRIRCFAASKMCWCHSAKHTQST